jgi:serine/threonine-protein kinase HipA
MTVDAKSVDQLDVFKHDQPAGTLVRTLSGCAINFTEEFKKKHTMLTFKIPTQPTPYEFKGAGLPPYFAGLLPEGLRLRSLIKKIKTSPDDLFSLLVAAGSDTIGSIHFGRLISENLLEEIPNDFNLLKSQLKQGVDPGRNSLAGVQDKISADRLFLPLNLKKKNKSYILKLSSTEFPDVIANEISSLSLAKACGLDVNNGEIITDDDKQQALLIERFDREWNKKEKKWDRFHQEDACQFLDRYPADKYIISFQDIADEIAKLSTSPEIEILNLMKLKAFSYLIGNGDLHAKNISLMQKTDSDIVKLTPYYDLLCTAIYGDQKMALPFLGKTENLKKKTFIEFGQLYEIPEAATASMLAKLTKKFADNYERFFNFPLAKEKETFLRSFFKKRLQYLD